MTEFVMLCDMCIKEMIFRLELFSITKTFFSIDVMNEYESIDQEINDMKRDM